MTTTLSHGTTTLPGYEVDALVFDGDPTRIYRARRLFDGTPVMLKALRDENAAREAAACLRHEYEMAQRLMVPSVIRAYSLERYKGFPVVVFEDFGGDSLNNIARERTLPLPELLHIALQVAKGLGEIHAASIIHKDLNPSNIVYNARTGIVKIIDFGISTYLTREQAALANPNVFEGSLPYISPEQTGRMNRSIDYRTDFYSFGVTLYELLTGRPLFVVSEPIEWFHCHIAKQPKPPGELDPKIPTPLSDIVMKLLAKTAEDRYQSARGIEADLRHCLQALETSGAIPAFPLAQHDAPDRFQILQRLYGREHQVDQLLTSFERITRGSSELILISGYSGIGKTCLVREIYKPVTERRGYFVAGKFDQLHRNVPYSALTAALRDLVRQLLTESGEKLAEWRHKIVGKLGGNAQLVVEIIRELELIVGPQPPVPPLPPLEAEQRFHRVFHRFIQLFCDPAHPLVIFLDDLQWADGASLKLLDLLAAETASPQLLLIGAYRDNEVGASHPLMHAVKQMRERGASVTEIQLRPLSREHLAELLSDALGRPREDVQELAELVEQKTAGNPFFTEEFLRSLHKAGLISFCRERGRWQWDMEHIRAQRITDNVVELMADRLRQLAPETRELLELGACIGNRFKLSVLALVCQRPAAEVAVRLRAGMSEGMIAPIGDAYQLLELEQSPGAAGLTVEFAFAHDRIQQAAYSLLDAGRRREAHLKIGRLLLEHLPAAERDERLFEIVSHLNLGAELIEEGREREELCRLNLEVGRRALAATAYEAAFGFFRHAIALLGGNAWRDRYELALALHAQGAEAAYLCGEHAAMQELLDTGLAEARSLLDKTTLYKVQTLALIARGQLREALDLALPVLGQLGHRYPRKPTQLHVLFKLMRVMRLLRRNSLDELRELPQMTDPQHLAAMALGMHLGRSAMFTEPLLLPLMILHGVEVSIKHGYTEASLGAYGAFGMILAYKLGQVDRAQAFGQLALELTDKLQAKPIAGRVVHVHNALVRHWKEPLRDCLDGLQEAFQLCVENGDFEFAALAAVVRVSYAYDSGMSLDRWHEELEVYAAALKPLKQKPALEVLDCFRQCADNLAGNAADPALIEGRFYHMPTMAARHEASGDISLIGNDRLIQAQFHYAFGNYREALACAERLQKARAGADGFYHAVRLNMLDSLVRLANVPLVDRKTARRFIRRTKANQRELGRWARNNPANCMHRYLLVEAELLRAQGRDFEAHPLYDQSIDYAREHGFMQDEGFAHELCGRMHMAAGRRPLGLPYLASARSLYRNWGAKALVQHLERDFPQLTEASPSGTSRSTKTVVGPLASVDIGSLMKALRTIADEQVHSRMLEAIIATAVEFAGAQRGLLILRNAERVMRIEGEASVDGGEPRILQSLPISEDTVPLSLINYVTRTGTSIVVNDAQHGDEALPGLDRDPYLQSHGVRSVLCLPILSGLDDKRELIGVLYLENNRASASFTRERLDTLEIICMSATGRLELSRRAAVDGLTQLFNHDYFQNVLAQVFAAAGRHGRDLGLLLVDVDHFKVFNDTWGHQLGDRVLREVAQLIKNACRADDTVARYGGEEMAVVLPSTTAADAQAVAERVRVAVEQHTIEHEGHKLNVTISLGVAMLDAATADPATLIRRADVALYDSKTNGRNRVTLA